VNVSVFAESDIPTIGSFLAGSQTVLGIDIEKDGIKWYLIVNNSQDYENSNQRYYRFFVLGGTRRIDIVLNIQNVDDESPYFTLPPGSTSCAIRVSNVLNLYPANVENRVSS
jgi:hypothetical protein